MAPDMNILDRLLPLDGASFRNVVTLGVDTPMRYAELYAVLDDGRRIRLKDKCQLLGWDGRGARKTVLLRCPRKKIVRLRINDARRRAIRKIEHWDEASLVKALSAADTRVAAMRGRVHKLTGIDGSLLFAAERCEEPVEAVSFQPAAVPAT